MPIPTGTVYFSQIRTELNSGTGGSFPASGSMPLNDATFRSRLTDTSQNAPLGISAIRGNAFQRFGIAVDTTNYNIRNALIGAGWNGAGRASVDLIISSGVRVYSGTTGDYALNTGGPWPAGSSVNIYNSGYILGHGGAGGDGGNGRRPGSGGPYGGSAGSAGGPGLYLQVSTYVSNGGYICGGGGGGGGGIGRDAAALPGIPGTASTAGGGGGGGGAGAVASQGGSGGIGDGTSYPANGNGGTNGGYNYPGPGGQGALLYAAAPTTRQWGGAGGSWGAAGAAGGNPPGSTPGFAGGPAGIAIQGYPLFSGGGGTILGGLA